MQPVSNLDFFDPPIIRYFKPPGVNEVALTALGIGVGLAFGWHRRLTKMQIASVSFLSGASFFFLARLLQSKNTDDHRLDLSHRKLSTLADRLESLPVSYHFPTVRTVVFRDCNVDLRSLERIASRFPNLKALQIEGTAVKHVDSKQRLSNLRVKRLVFKNVNAKASQLNALLQRLSAIEECCLDGCNIARDGGTELFSSLKTIFLSGSKFDLATLDQCPSLHRVVIQSKDQPLIMLEDSITFEPVRELCIPPCGHLISGEAVVDSYQSVLKHNKDPKGSPLGRVISQDPMQVRLKCASCSNEYDPYAVRSSLIPRVQYTKVESGWRAELIDVEEKPVKDTAYLHVRCGALFSESRAPEDHCPGCEKTIGQTCREVYFPAESRKVDNSSPSWKVLQGRLRVKAPVWDKAFGSRRTV